MVSLERLFGSVVNAGSYQAVVDCGPQCRARSEQRTCVARLGCGYDVIAANPPYFRENCGALPAQRQRLGTAGGCRGRQFRRLLEISPEFVESSPTSIEAPRIWETSAQLRLRPPQVRWSLFRFG